MQTIKNETVKSKTITCYGTEVKFEVKPETLILVDGWEKMLTTIQESEVPELGEVRIKSPTIPDVAALANVSITGRTLQRRNGYYSFFVRVAIEFIRGDDLETSHSSGWLIQEGFSNA